MIQDLPSQTLLWLKLLSFHSNVDWEWELKCWKWFFFIGSCEQHCFKSSKIWAFNRNPVPPFALVGTSSHYLQIVTVLCNHSLKVSALLPEICNFYSFSAISEGWMTELPTWWWGRVVKEPNPPKLLPSTMGTGLSSWSVFSRKKINLLFTNDTFRQYQ